MLRALIRDNGVAVASVKFITFEISEDFVKVFWQIIHTSRIKKTTWNIIKSPCL